MKKQKSTYPLRLPASLKAAEADLDAARRLLRRDGGQPPAPDDRLP